MNKDNVKKWAEALRSGKYEQCNNALYDHGQYCCLGVVCEIAGIERVGAAYGNLFPEENFLPPEACDWLGVDDDNPKIGPHRATYWNDNAHATFPEIAALIERYWLAEGTEAHE